MEAARIDLHTALRNLHTAGDDPDLATLLTPLSTPITPDTARGDLTRAADAAAQASRVFDAAAESRRGLQQAVTAADIRRSSASAARRTFDRDSLDLDERSRAAATALQKTRDTVAGLGAPVVDTADLIAAWDTLTRWAAAERATRSAQLPALREAAADAATAAAAASRRTYPSRRRPHPAPRQAEHRRDRPRPTHPDPRPDRGPPAESKRCARCATQRRAGYRAHRRTRPPRPGCCRGARRAH